MCATIDIERAARELVDQATRGQITKRAAERMIGALYLQAVAGAGWYESEATGRRRRAELRRVVGATSDRA